jgi:glutathione S-transferase
MGLPPDHAVVSDALRSVEMFFDVAERLLQRKDYMAESDFTLVDIYYIPLIQRLSRADTEKSSSVAKL